MLLLPSPLAAELPPPGEKSGYTVALVVGAGAEPDGVVSPRVLWAPSRSWIVGAGATWTMQVNESRTVAEGDYVDQRWASRAAYWAPEVGASYNFAHDGMEGWGPGLRLDLGRVTLRRAPTSQPSWQG
jgi:hypothetical protein